MTLNSANDQSYKIKHIGIVMDGNGRWAKAKGLPRVLGHHEGVKAVERTVRAAKELDIPYISLYAFSTENWKRPKSEVMGLMGLFRYYMRSKLAELCKEETRMRFAGDLSALPEDIQGILKETEEKTRQYTERQLIICFNYGGRQEIIDTVNRIVSSGKKEHITEKDIRDNLYLPDVPDPDLLIRTCNEQRISNFLLWQLAYTEFYFSPVAWPDFSREDLVKAVEAYQNRNRKFGLVKEE